MRGEKTAEAEHDRAQFLTLIDRLLDTYKPYGVLIWLNAVNRHLDPMGTTPVHLIAHSNWQPLLDEADRLAGGAR